MRAGARALIATALVVAMTPALDAQRERPRVCNVDAPAPAPLDLTLRDLNGRGVPLAIYRGKILLVNFWATWCVPCKAEIPDLIELYRRYRSRGVEILGIDVDESPATVRPFVTTMKVTYPVLLTEGRHDVPGAFGVDAGLPTTVLVTRDGSICRRRVGLTSRDLFELMIKAAL